METDIFEKPGIDLEDDQENMQLDDVEEDNEYKASEHTEENEIEENEEEEIEKSTEEMETIDYDRIETIVQTATAPADLDTLLDNLAVTDVLMLILALVLGIMIVKARN